MASSRSSSNEVSQYHHFIPQFILRNFAHVYRPTRGQGHRSGNGKPKLYKGQQALNTVNLSTDPPELAESPLRRSFGLVDMYRDFTNIEDQQYLEKHLGKLESQAAQIIARVCKKFNNGSHAVWMSRSERNDLRKFFFLMKYRGKGFQKRFLGDTTQGYVEDDKDEFLEYMRKRNFRTPLEVWFHSIKTILDLQIDIQGQWRKDLPNQMYPGDAFGFIIHSHMMYLAFCTPSDPKLEFIVTENCYSIHEGPVSLYIDPITRDTRKGVWTSYHEFGPLSPKLIMVLRSFVLPNPEEDKNEDIKKWREEIFALNSSQHPDPSTATSILADLPVRKARNSYTIVDDTGLHLRDGEDGSSRSYHEFCFEFFKIPAEHVNTINSIMLENAHEHKLIAFASRDSLRETLEQYITVPSDRKFKLVFEKADDSRLQFLRKLEQVLHKLGSNGRLVYHLRSLPDQEQMWVEIRQKFVENLPEKPTEFMRLHMKLGGSQAGILVDMDQARRMLNMRIKIDVWSQGVEENIRQQTRENLTDLFCQDIPLQRLWLYMKHIRSMLLSSKHDTNNIEQVCFEGPEDVIVKTCDIVNPKKLGRLLCLTVMQHIFNVQHPGIDFSAPITMDEAGAAQAFLLLQFAFDGPYRKKGSICDCGIDPLETRGRLIRATLRETTNRRQLGSLLWSDDQNIELAIRAVLRKNFKGLLGSQLTRTQLQELQAVLFTIVYPTPSRKASSQI